MTANNRVVRKISQSFCIALMLFAACLLLAQNNNQAHRVRNIVLVHGAWADGSGWKGVYDILVKDGYNVSVVQEPETTFQEDVAATKRNPCPARWPVHFGGSQLWRSRNYRSGDGLVGGWPGVHRRSHAGCGRERGGRWKALPPVT